MNANGNKSCNIATASLNSSNSFFSSTAVKSRSLNEASNALPKSPHKRSMIKSLTSSIYISTLQNETQIELKMS